VYNVGVTYSAVVTTGIYCRPGCGAKPRADHVRTFTVAGAAEAAGFRACLRCRPYRVSGSLPWDAPELVCRAVQLVIAGVLDDGSEQGLGARLGLSPRHLRRLFQEHLGLTPDQFARSRRAHFARRLLDDTDLDVVDVAFASGFGSVRQFNRTMQEVFRASPRDLRARRRRTDRLVADGGLSLRLPAPPGFDWTSTLVRLSAQAVAGVEVVSDGTYRRTVGVDGEPGLVEVSAAGTGELRVTAHLPFWEGLIHVVERCGRLTGATAASSSTRGHVGAWTGFEAAVRTIVSSGCRPDDVRARMEALARRYGEPVAGLGPGLDRAFPGPARLRSLDGAAVGLSADTTDALRRLSDLAERDPVLLEEELTGDDMAARLTTLVAS
jgi:AraC family transcriptional regulator of adaptative response / DNA-3-methyladenine glycosylase II